MQVCRAGVLARSNMTMSTLQCSWMDAHLIL